MSERLLVGIGDGGGLTEPRRDLVSFLTALGGLGVDIRVAAFADGEAVAALSRVTAVHRAEPLPRRSPAALVEGAARRIHPGLGAAVLDARTRRLRHALGEPDAVLLQGALGLPLLRAVRRSAAPVTVLVHPWDHGIAGLPPRDRRDLVARADRFLVADGSLVGPLVDAGVDPERIEPAPDLADLVPAPPPSPASRTRARSALDLPADRPLVVVPPMPGWSDLPDHTLAVAREVQRLAGGASPPLFLWHGMPPAGEPGWPLAHEVEHTGVRNVRTLARELTWEEGLEVADVVLLPLGPGAPGPEGWARAAARRAVPVACDEAHPRAAEVRRWGGVTTGRGDVRALASVLHGALADEGARRRLREATWAAAVAEVERLVPLGVPLP